MKVIGLLDVYRFQFESFNSSSFFFLFCTSRRLMRFRFSRKRPQNVCILSTIDSLSAICNFRLIDSPDGGYHFEEDQTRRKSNEKRIKREENQTGGFYTWRSLKRFPFWRLQWRATRSDYSNCSTVGRLTMVTKAA